MPELPATIHVTWAPAPADLAEPLAPLLPERASPLAVVPAPLERGNTVIAALRAAWRQAGLRTTLLLPRAGLASVLGRDPGRWRRVGVSGPTVRLDHRIADGSYVAVLVVTDGLRTGPFVLDLPPRFLHPLDRLRLTARPDGLRLHADVAAAAPPLASIVLAPVEEGWLAVATADPIAAELWALALAERWLGNDVEMRGPWEDQSVQRATELDLGVRIPGDMVVRPIGGATFPAMARELLMETAGRLGMSLSPGIW